MASWADLTKAQQHALEATVAPDDMFDTVVTWRGWSDWSAAVVNGNAATSLAAMGLVTTHTNPDYRHNRLVRPTEAGRRCYDERPDA